MRSFAASHHKVNIPVATSWLMGACMEGKGKQALWLAKRPKTLAALRELAIVQSAESSKRIEGVTVPTSRLRPILLGGERPLDRSEEELVGYRRALDWIHTSHEAVSITPPTVLHLHALAQGGSTGDAGMWKTRNNEIIELLPNGERRIRFVPVAPDQVPHAMQQLCLGYRDVCAQGQLPPLLAVASLVLDLLCIHPFRDGNGRVSRLLTLLALYQHGYLVGRYVSLERVIEETKQSYYDALAASSVGWHEGEHNLMPWWNYYLSTLKQAHDQLERRLEVADTGVVKTELVRRAALAWFGPFSLADLAASLPSVSRQLVKKVLSDLKREGRVVLEGRGRGARWHVT